MSERKRADPHRWAMEKRIAHQLPPGPAHVLIALADYADADGKCWPAQESLALATGYSRRSVGLHLADLEQRGIITRERWHNEHGHRGPDTYTLVGYADAPRREVPAGSQGEKRRGRRRSLSAESAPSLSAESAPSEASPKRRIRQAYAQNPTSLSAESAQEVSSEVNKEVIKPLSASTDADGGDDAPASARLTPRERESEKHPKRDGQSKPKSDRRQSKAPKSEKALAKRTDHGAYIDAYEQHRGFMPAVIPDGTLKRRLSALEREHGPEELVRLIEDGTRGALADKGDYWVTNQLGLADLLRGDNLTRKAAAWRNAPGMSAADRRLAAAAARLPPSLDSFDFGDHVRHPEHGDGVICGEVGGKLMMDMPDGRTERVDAGDLLRLRRPPTGPRPAAVDAYVASKRPEPTPDPDPDAELVVLEPEDTPPAPPAVRNGAPKAKPPETEAEREQRLAERREALRRQAEALTADVAAHSLAVLANSEH